MSIDLEWNKLDSSLATYLIEVLNRQLSTTERPSFIGPVEVTALDFGSTSPDVELVDMRDIYRDFLEDDDETDDPVKVTENADDDDGYEWVSRRAAGRDEGLAYQHLPPHIRYGRTGSTDMFSTVPPSIHSPLPVHMDMWNGMSPPSFSEFKPPYTPWSSTSMYRSPSPATPFANGPLHRGMEFKTEDPEVSLKMPSAQASSTELSPPESSELTPPPPPPPEPENPHPNVQLHFHVNWRSNLRITLTTSLLINYPSPMFMSLPIKLSVIGLIFNGELAVAYEGERRRVHICILDDLDPYGPAGDRPKRDSTNSTPPELDDESLPSGIPPRPPKPLPVGQRLLPSIYIESEIGQADKHVLKNVTRVERFIQDVIRKTVEEELVFPNFHTLVMGDG
ncbi:hypothetical protein BDQ12DRAFT_686753 [Crucibulum laeve]|uniref:Mitochondrial distribution and morphology protein 12 n=1 Tax=Crucibulum laeve TaxID=68775 RepID=A0A5C3LW49_9AGAR|nr:hypothetical protein BDQ12DRAFT_686753 [Crucibulum laeve]